MIGGYTLEQILKDKLSKVLFHGTLMDRAANIILEGVDFSKLNERADFGKGFYLTDSYALARNTALTRYNEEKQSNGSSYPPVVIRLKVKCDNLLAYNIKEFYGEDNDWKRFVCCNRWYNDVIKHNPNADNNIGAKYDIIIGLTADGKMGQLGRLIKKHNYALSDGFIKSLKPFRTTYKKIINNKVHVYETKAYQISFHNEKFVNSCVEYSDYDIIQVKKEDGYYE